ncbi:MAG: hypothetical protein ACK4MQ_11775 [Hyphomonas sp.]
MSQSNPSAISRYCDCMEDLKARLALIKRMTEGYSPLGTEGLDGEVVCLQLRRILEQIAFGSLLAHRETYEAAHKDLEKVWRAKSLLSRLEQLHPDYYPLPLRETPDKPKGELNFEPIKDGFLTPDEFIFLYDTASSGIHTWNPFKVAARVINFERSIAEWIGRVQRLLSVHLVRFVGKDEVWLVQMQAGPEGKVHAYTATSG